MAVGRLRSRCVEPLQVLHHIPTALTVVPEQDYYALNITQYLDSDLIKPLISIIDPLNYKENLTMPKLVIDATGDEFFMPDDDHFWWGDLEGETYRLMVANADHSMSTGLGPLYMSLSAFYQSVLIDAQRPVINWTMAEGTGTITAVSNIKANKVGADSVVCPSLLVSLSCRFVAGCAPMGHLTQCG